MGEGRRGRQHLDTVSRSCEFKEEPAPAQPHQGAMFYPLGVCSWPAAFLVHLIVVVPSSKRSTRITTPDGQVELPGITKALIGFAECAPTKDGGAS
jgi:hypothetical protein